MGQMYLIHMASGLGFEGGVRYLLKNRADVNKKSLDNDRPHILPLLEAAYMNQPKTAKILIESKADIFLEDRAGATALLCAAMSGNSKTLRMILDTEEFEKSDSDKKATYIMKRNNA